ncbi:diguanylate cyclase [Maribius pontilimi]|uniref:Diguanylate cyclase n=1 Tax=Palleronia pontilimi TaxID=1964209 RepID=A0A934IJ07_9RHOB|nr:diguanylate cyclase [Palleronia pontilimi]MBJ3763445.1 diguanylate cyclase [Palleronia pontilimi]
MSGVKLGAGALDTLLPMHLRFDDRGIVRHLGPGLARLAGKRKIVGQPVLDAFQWTRPSGIDTLQTLLSVAGQRLRLNFRAGRRVRLRGIVQPMEQGAGGIIDLALDLSELRDLGGAPLTRRDFSPTDPTVDILYLIEANNAAMAASRRLIDRLQGAKCQAETQAFTDMLTGLSNRRALDRVLDRLVESGEPFSLTHVDLDFFKKVNDTLGHAAGDYVLTVAATRLRDATRQTDTVARVGGDEFVVLFRGLTDPNTLNIIAGRIISSLEQPVNFEGKTCTISASLGTAISTHYSSPDVDRMMADADAALYTAKRAGRGQYRIAAPDTLQDSAGNDDRPALSRSDDAAARP